ncbi:MAG: thioredoxin domain-containing protein [Candidatus Methylarchaceae archaeon HK02M1]|nr:thioredoxin domain-containing protein [Candidatus Methylarchaceae archaeon HK02M1]
MNRLSKEKSPYLLEHAYNPVYWYPWGEEAFARARAEDKPIFLSIGYSSCHWCHVMKRESFEDMETADILNRNFVSIKVDREERPDIDKIYMTAVVSMLGRGGWPLSVFLTPFLKPFFGGTYYPLEDRYGMPSFKKILTTIIELWKTKRAGIEESAERITLYLTKTYEHVGGALSAFPLDAAYSSLVMGFDEVYGGFGGAPKFPNPSLLFFLTRYFNRTKKTKAIEIVTKTLTKIAKGGVFDQLGGGFHRYSVDRYWLVPHFEKMLYDNALLSLAYLEAWQATRNPLFARVVTQTLDWALREMRDSRGGFYSTQDSESEGEEGAYYVWRKDEIVRILGQKDGEIFSRYYGISEEGNFEKGRNVLHVEKESSKIAEELGISEDSITEALRGSKKMLLENRELRVKPFTDDKVLTAWNGMMISALTKAYQILGYERYLKAAEASVDFILGNLVDGEKLLRRWRDGEASVEGFLEDYAFMVMGLIDFYESNFDESKLKRALKLNKKMVELFLDEEKGGFYSTQVGQPDLISRVKDAYDGATLSGNSVAALNLAKLSELTSDKELRSLSEKTILAFWDKLNLNPEQSAHMLCALDFLIGQPKEFVITGKKSSREFQAMLKEIRQTLIPNKVIAYNPDGQDSLIELIPLLKDKSSIGKAVIVYVCQNYTCQMPVMDVESLKTLLE